LGESFQGDLEILVFLISQPHAQMCFVQSH
jgi:hypothetical protein